MFPTREETEIWVALNRTHRSIHRTIDSELRSQGLASLNWYDILWTVEMAGPDGIRPFELQDALLFEQSNLSRSIAKMISQGLLAETVCTQDKRGKLLTISDDGRKLRLKSWQVYGALIHRLVGEIAPEGAYARLFEAMGVAISSRRK